MRALLLASGLVLFSAHARAQDEAHAGGGADDLLIEVDRGPGHLNPGNVQISSVRRQNAGGFMLIAGGLGAALGAGLMIGEYVVKPGPGEQKVWSDKGCMASFVFGALLLPAGLHMAAAGIAMLSRSRTLSSVARSMQAEGPGPRWRGWYDEGKALRSAGNVFSMLGTAFISMALVSSVPYGICKKWKCQAWPEYGQWEGWSSQPVALSAGFGIAGALLSTLGLSMLIAGYVKQARFIDESRPVALVLSPGGMSLAW